MLWLLQNIIACEYELPAGAALSAECRDLIRRILCPRPAERITMPQVKQHPWLVQPPPQVSRCLCVGVPLPELRGGRIASGYRRSSCFKPWSITPELCQRDTWCCASHPCIPSVGVTHERVLSPPAMFLLCLSAQGGTSSQNPEQARPPPQDERVVRDIIAEAFKSREVLALDLA